MMRERPGENTLAVVYNSQKSAYSTLSSPSCGCENAVT
jgi:hypothetical protein